MREKGTIITLVLVFGSIFSLLLAGLIGFVLLQHRQSLQKVAWTESLQIAEAGINYARWHLAHAPSDFNFSGIYDYRDPQEAVIGQYQLEITAPSGCHPPVTIESTGWTSKYPEVERKIQVKYAKPALAKYAFLTHSNVWFGPDEELKGPFHSNGGIRMDGIQNSLSASAKETYICGAEHGCSFWDCPFPCSWTSSHCECPGIWGAGEGQAQGLWEFPVPAIDFDSIVQDLAVLKSEAEAAGTFFGPSGAYGWRIQFVNDSTFNLYKVTGLRSKVWGYDGEGWVYESNDINTDAFQVNYSLPTGCAPIFVEDTLWVDGDVKGRVTAVAAKLPETPASMKKIIINGNIDYVDQDSVLGLIAQKDILIPLYSPDNLAIKASLLAKNGHVFRYYYPPWWWEPYKTYAKRDYIETYGSIITNAIWTFTWVKKEGWIEIFESGYENTNMMYDSTLTYNPPPYFPTTGKYEFVSWEELQ